MNNYIIFGKNIIIKEENMNTLYKSSLVISTIGCLNWGLVGLLNFNLVEYLFGDGSLLTRIVYALVMVAGLIQIGILTKDLDH